MRTVWCAAGLASLLLLAGCASKALVQATWYLQQAGDEAKPSIYVAILNRGPMDLVVHGLVLNTAGRQAHEGWTEPFKEPARLHPGAMLVRKINTFERPARVGQARASWSFCQLPLDVLVQVADMEPLWIDLGGQMPSALPNGWEDCPGEPSDKDPANRPGPAS